MKRSQIKRKAPDPQAQLKEALRESKKLFKNYDPKEWTKHFNKTNPIFGRGRLKRNKYGAVKTQCHDILHDSKLEAGHAKELRLAQKAGLISKLLFQHELSLIVEERLICIYIADFCYFHEGTKKYTIADSKGKETAVFRLKWKLAQATHPNFDFVMFKKPWIEL